MNDTIDERVCAICVCELNDDLPANRPIPVTVGESVTTVCGSCWRSIRPEVNNE